MAILPLLVLALASAGACGDDSPPLFAAGVEPADAAFLGEPLRPLPPPADLDPERVALGRRLFHDAALSRDGKVSCASCHRLPEGGADRVRYSTRSGGELTPVNTPTVLNTALNFRWSWDGEAPSLEAQMALTTHEELGLDTDELAARLAADPGYAQAFREAYGGLGIEQVVDALVVFQRSLLTPSRFDRYLRGDHGALSDAEREGYGLFKSLGCAACHQGAGVGGNMFQRVGVLGDYFGDRGDITEADYGRFNVTGREDDRFVFKVPSLRNVARTAPYFHDGSIATLEQAVRTMGRYQLGRDLSDDEVGKIATFLATLSSEGRGGAG